MSHWDPNQVPPHERYQYLNQNYGNPGVYYNVDSTFDNISYYAQPQYAQNYNQTAMDYYMVQQYFNVNNNRPVSHEDVTQGTAFHRMNLNDPGVGQPNVPGSSSTRVSNSTLTATAKEFQPNTSTSASAPQTSQNHGAIKKDQNYRRNKSNYDQGNSSRSSWSNRNWQRSSHQDQRNDQHDDRGKSRFNKKSNSRTSQQSQVLQGAKTFMQNFTTNSKNSSKENIASLPNETGKRAEVACNSEESSVAGDANETRKEPSNAGDRSYRGRSRNEDQRGNDKFGKRNPYKNNLRYDNYYNKRDDRGNRNYSREINRSYGDRTNNDKDRYSSRDSSRYYERRDKQDAEKNGSNFKDTPRNSEDRQETSKRNYREEVKIPEDKKERNFRDNWRNSSKFTEKKTEPFERKYESRNKDLKKKLDAASQRERLEEMVMRKLLECLVCCEKIRHTDEVWSCKQCYHILHLNCVIRWAKASKLDTGWRCPACQNVNNDIPNEYRCFCNKVIRPPLEPGATPHSCGETCGRKGRSCDHTCTLLCHPGPCPDCNVMVRRSCNCGSTQMLALCSAVFELVCKNICNKLLECGLHNCKRICHSKECDTCPEFVRQECYCGKVGRKVQCTREIGGATAYECGEVCGRRLDCGNHHCQKLCHPGKCDPCAVAPAQINSCPCGQTTLTEKRTTCLDPIPTCDKICNKPLKCGQPSAPHQCKNPCHDGPCPPCPLTTLVRCRCGHMDKELTCTELKTKADDARCEKRCLKKRQCYKHKCNQLCCIDLDHICPLICNHMLSCGLHRCEETCHRGRCPPCWRTSFQELFCECGSSVLYPPVACGTRPPPCSKSCSRTRDCGHEVNHNCHPGPCPPCTVLAVRWCHGQHEQRSTIPCHQGNFSCGLPCSKEMACGRHKCIQPCHTGPCPAPCTQPCNTPREACSHPCNAPCHEEPCPETPCKQIVKVTCQCGLRSSTRTCMDLAGEYQSIAMSQLASKMADIQRGQTVDISDIVSSQKKPGTLKTLECNEECRIVERNRRLTIGLQIRNPDLSSKLMPRYSDYMKAWGKKDGRFCQMVHEQLSELVQLAKQSKQKSRSHSFKSMNRDKRHFIHEYCEHFGCESAAYDQEPNRNVVATASRDKSWLPSLSLLEVIQRENGQRKVPGPVLSKSSTEKSESVSLNKLPSRIPRPATPPGEYVDYFNDPPV